MGTTTLSEAYRDHPLHLRHIIPLDFGSTPTVPESHVWPHSDGFSSADISGDLPVVDMRDPDAAELMGRACETWGAFQLMGHGIPMKLIEEVELEARRLFGLPAEQKLKALRSPGGATGYGVARITPFFTKYMWHEGFTIMGSPIDHARELWPHGYQQFCETMESYQKQMKLLADDVMRIMLKSLNISEQELSWLANKNLNQYHTTTAPCTALQLNSYPSCPDPNRAMGLAPHTDTFLLTVLHQTAHIDGLQISKEAGPTGSTWVPVRPANGALVVNVGDLFQILSNGRFTSVVHRVVVNQTRRQRFSVAYFYGPPADFAVSPLLSSGQQDQVVVPRYRSVTVKEYVGIKAKNLDKALSLIKI
ncbi:Gibberellin-3 oxidase [Parasponia andersonii]|uniref:gibberellin 3beta-dioxygenase n=1 Tax=Parasponia andersonii TaxID=3476 RepID=A0A2P5CA94_PARAD|nr:Gibberellin-3 oxidase [Parasponia andersonii]